MRFILLQIKFLIVAFLNVSLNFVPIFLRVYYLRIYGIKVGRHSFIHRHVRFFHVGLLEVGENSIINFGCYLDNRRGIKIGNNVGIAHDTRIYSLGHDINDSLFRTKGKKVVIRDNVFIFSNCIIMPGVEIGEGAIVLAGSVVTKDVAPFSICGGNPAVKIRERNTQINYKLYYPYMFAL